MADLSGGARAHRERTDRWLAERFWPEDEHLRSLRREAERRGLPPIDAGADTARLLELLIRLGGARRVLEIGTLAGMTATWMARGLPDGGVVDTIEYEDAHADLAEEWARRAGLGDRVRVLRGAALDVLATLSPPYDLAFIDATKTEYVAYLDHLLRLVRPGGLICADNVHWGGRVADPEVADADTEGLRAFLRRIASEPRLVSTVVPTGDGLSLSLVLPPPG